MIDKWKHRRFMSYISMFAGLVYPLLIIVSDSEQLGVIAVPFYLFITAIVSAYLGFATLDNKWDKDNERL